MALTGAVGAAAIVLFWLGQGPNGASHSAVAARSPLELPLVLNQDNALALRYARACQSGDCDEIIGLTGWMRDRLRRSALETPGDEAQEAVRDELRARLQERTVEGNRLRPEGVEDMYVFAPGTQVEFVASDRGREDLSEVVRERVWLRVTYPAPDRALRDETGRPIRSIIVGVNVSAEGYIVKAGVLGNLDVDRDSISYAWDEGQGG